MQNMVYISGCIDGGLTGNRPIDRNSLIASFPELASIQDAAWLHAVETAQVVKAEAKTILLDNKTQSGQFLLLLAGMVRVYYPADDGREATLYRINPGEICVLGLNNLFQNKTINVVAQAEANIYALGISTQNFRLAIKQSKGFRDFVLATLNSRLYGIMGLVKDTAFNNLSVRLAHLLRCSFDYSRSSRIEITHQQLANELGTTREVISRVLKDLELKDCVTLSRGYIELNSITNLEALTQSSD